MTVKIEVFSTDSCPHCPAAVAIAEEVKAELGDIEVEVVKIADNESRERAINYGIMAVPTVVVNNEPMPPGAPFKQDLIDLIKSL